MASENTGIERYSLSLNSNSSQGSNLRWTYPPSINEDTQRLTKHSNEVTGRDFLSSQFVPAAV